MAKLVKRTRLKILHIRNTAGSNPASRTIAETVFGPGDVMVAMLVLEASAERRGSSSLPWGTNLAKETILNA